MRGTIGTVRSFDVAIVGGGLVGASIAYGLTRAGSRVVVLDEGDMAVRASRGNFALVWVQMKGLGMPEYAAWTARSSEAWGGFADMLAEETGFDVAFERPGGFILALDENEFTRRAETLRRFHNQPSITGTGAVMMERSEVAKYLPDIGPDVVGGSYGPMDGHVNSLRLFRALHTALARQGATYLASHAVTAIVQRDGEFQLTTTGGSIRAGKVVLAAGNANADLAPMVGLSAPMKPERGQIIVTERARPFLRHPIGTVRQTDEGTVMIGDSKEDGDDPVGINPGINAVVANRAVRMFPLLGKLNVVRTWRAVRVMPADGFPIYDQSATHPGAFLATCHSGVTLAATHALELAAMIHRGSLDPHTVGAFSSRRFDVSKAA